MKPANKTVASTKPMSFSKGTAKKQFKVVEKQQIKPKQGFTEFPTAKLASIKTVDPFSDKKGNSFAHLYSSGAIPCKIEHGTLHMRLKWNPNVTISQLPYNPLLVTCFEGLIQEKHPYGFIAYNVSKDMVEDEDSAEKLIELLNKLVWPLRTALSSSNQTISLNALEILRGLSNKVGSHLNPHIKNLVTPIKRHMNSKKLKQKAIEILRCLEDNGGQDVSKVIKGAIPTYSST